MVLIGSSVTEGALVWRTKAGNLSHAKIRPGPSYARAKGFEALAQVPEHRPDICTHRSTTFTAACATMEGLRRDISP